MAIIKKSTYRASLVAQMVKNKTKHTHTHTYNKCCEDMEKRARAYIVGGNKNWCSHGGKQHGGSLKN